MWEPTVPAGWTPSNTSWRIRSSSGMRSPGSGPVQTKTGPSVSRARAARPRSNGASQPATIAATDGPIGLVSIAVTKIEWGRVAGSATRPKGRARSAVHWPDSTSSARTLSPVMPDGCRPANALNDAVSGERPSRSARLTSITIDCSARRSPRLTATMVPAAGAV